MWNFEPRIGFAWNLFHSGNTVLHAGVGMFDVLPLPYAFRPQYCRHLRHSRSSAPIKTPKLGTGQADPNVSFNEQKIRNRYIQPNPKRADVYNWNVYVQQNLGAETSR